MVNNNVTDVTGRNYANDIWRKRKQMWPIDQCYHYNTVKFLGGPAVPMYFINFPIDGWRGPLARSGLRASTTVKFINRRHTKARYRIHFAIMFLFLRAVILTIFRRKEGICITYGYVRAIVLIGFHETDNTVAVNRNFWAPIVN